MRETVARFCEGLTEASWLAALTVAPLFFNTYSSRTFEPDKAAMICSFAMMALAASVSAYILRLRRGAVGAEFRRLAALPFVPLVLSILGVVAAYGVSSVLSVAPRASVWGSFERSQGLWSMLSYMVLFAVVAARLRRREQIDRILTVVAVVSLPISLYAILQRLGSDPHMWGTDTADRVSSTLGNPIFLAGYLIMAAMVVLSRLVATIQGLMAHGRRVFYLWIRATLYVLLFLLNLAAIWFTQSRGPQLGLMVGLFAFALLMAAHSRLRRWALAAIGGAILVAAFVVLLNVPQGPLARLTEIPGFNRLAHLLDEFRGEGGTWRVRVLVWAGTLDLARTTEPLQYPDGTSDWLLAARPWIGYGPETMLLTYNRHYSPDLRLAEGQESIPDRAHNRTLDALVSVGLVGLISEMALFVTLFYYGLRWLGLMDSKRRRSSYLVLVLGCGALGSALGGGLYGPVLIGAALPMGIVLGLIAFISMIALFESSSPGDAAAEPWRAMVLIGLLSAIMAHFTELQFGIAVVATQTYFWIYLGAVLAVGHGLAQQAGTSAANPIRRGRPGSVSDLSPGSPWIAPVARSVTLSLVLVITIGFDFIQNSLRAQESQRIVWNSLTAIARPEGPQRSFAVLWIVLLSCLAVGVLHVVEEGPRGPNAARGRAIIAGLGLNLLAALLIFVMFGQTLARAASEVGTVDEVFDSASRIISVYHALLLAALLIAAWGLRPRGPLQHPFAYAVPASPLLSLGLVFGAVYLAVTLNMNGIKAGVGCKMGLWFINAGRPHEAAALLEHAVRLAPMQDRYRSLLGQAYFSASADADPRHKDKLVRIAEVEFSEARRLCPLNPDHTANLARLYRQWSVEAPTNQARRSRAVQADQLFRQAVQLRPKDPVFWNAWAVAAFELLGDGPAAQQRLETSIRIDPTFAETYRHLGDYYRWSANRESDPVKQQAWSDRAREAFQRYESAATRER